MAPPLREAQPTAGAGSRGRRHDPSTRPGTDPPPQRPSRIVGPKTASLERPGHPRSPGPSYADTRSARRSHRFGDGRGASIETDVVTRARQVQCDRVSFSCKGRGACPSCNAKRMAETAAHLVENVIPHVPVRQVVLSLPKRLRPFLHHRPRTAGAVLHILLRALQATLREACPTAPATASIGAVSFLHRFASSLNPHFHYHRATWKSPMSSVSQGDANDLMRPVVPPAVPCPDARGGNDPPA